MQWLLDTWEAENFPVPPAFVVWKWIRDAPFIAEKEENSLCVFKLSVPSEDFNPTLLQKEGTNIKILNGISAYALSVKYVDGYIGLLTSLHMGSSGALRSESSAPCSPRWNIIKTCIPACGGPKNAWGLLERTPQSRRTSCQCHPGTL